MRVAEQGIIELQKAVDTLLIIPNQNLFRVANEKTTFADAFAMADQVLYSGVACITDLMVKEGLINLDFADVRAVMREMGKAMMGTGEASGEKRALAAAEAAISNPLIDDVLDEGRARPADLDHRRQGPRRSTRSTRPRPASARKSTATPTSSSARPSTKASKASSACRWWRPASTSPRSARQPAQHRGTTARRRAGSAGGRGGIAARRTDADAARQHAAHGRARGAARAHRAGASRGRAGARGRAAAEAAPVAEAPRRRADHRDRGRDHPADRAAEADAVRRAGRSGARKPRRALAEPEKPFIPPQAERPALRAPRMPRIDELPMPAQNQIRARETQAAEPRPGEAARVAAAAACLGRPRPARGARTRAEPRPAARPVPVAAERAAPPMPKAPPMPPLQRAPERAARIGVGIRQASGRPAAGSAGPRPARPAGACE